MPIEILISYGKPFLENRETCTDVGTLSHLLPDGFQSPTRSEGRNEAQGGASEASADLLDFRTSPNPTRPSQAQGGRGWERSLTLLAKGGTSTS